MFVLLALQHLLLLGNLLLEFQGDSLEYLLRQERHRFQMCFPVKPLASRYLDKRQPLRLLLPLRQPLRQSLQSRWARILIY